MKYEQHDRMTQQNNSMTHAPGKRMGLASRWRGVVVALPVALVAFAAPRVAADGEAAHSHPRDTVVLADFPTEPARLRHDMREIAPKIIARHGLEEWKAAVLTSELHRHLGTYSIVGAKMGLRAREFFQVDLDEVQVESHAGLKPPLSCVNDGLQVATGASLGRGTITVLTNAARCEAVFIHDDRRLRLRLKPEFAKRIATDMAELAKRHGGTTPGYFQAVRGVSLQHWLNFDRNTIFEEASETVSVKP